MKNIKSFEHWQKVNEELGKKDILAVLMSLAFLKPVQAQKIAADIEKKSPQAKSIILRKLPDLKTISDIKNIVYKDTASAIQRETIPEPKGYRPISLEQRKAWNEYLEYLVSKKLKGSPVLDEADRGAKELEKYLKDNPENPLNKFGNLTNLVKSIQYEMMIIRKGKSGFPGLTDEDLTIMQEYLIRTRKPFMELMPSEIDGKPGQITTQLYYPAKTFDGKFTLSGLDYTSSVEDWAFKLIDTWGIKFIDGVDLTNKLTPRTKQYLGSMYKSK